MKSIKNDKGITLITLVVTIVILTIMSITITVGIKSTIELRSYYDIRNDILKLSDAIDRYYLENEGNIDNIKGDECDFDISKDDVKKDMNPNDRGRYYIINTIPLDISLTNEESTYIFNENTLTVYCKEGYKIDDITHYTAIDTFEVNQFASDYYSEKIEIPEISVVILESNGEDKLHAKPGDIVTLKLLSSVYDFSQYKKQPNITLKLGDEKLTPKTNKQNGRTITMTFELGEFPTENNQLIDLNVSGYSIDGINIGKTITEPTFTKGVVYNIDLN